jgi:uncharacterized protein YbdZ (MbtH family)
MSGVPGYQSGGASSQLPQGWEARQDRTGRLYFVDHINKSTSWEDPRPLPAGWEMKVDEKQKRRYFVCHATRSTTWNDPRPPIVLPIPRPAVSPVAEQNGVGEITAALAKSSISQQQREGGEGADTSRIRSAYDGSHKQDLDCE